MPKWAQNEQIRNGVTRYHHRKPLVDMLQRCFFFFFLKDNLIRDFESDVIHIVVNYRERDKRNIKWLTEATVRMTLIRSTIFRITRSIRSKRYIYSSQGILQRYIFSSSIYIKIVPRLMDDFRRGLRLLSGLKIVF